MALIKCTECGNMVSDKADRCPHCGCPVSVILSETAKAPENPPVQEPAQRPVPDPKVSAPAVDPSRKQRMIKRFSKGLFLQCAWLFSASLA